MKTPRIDNASDLERFLAREKAESAARAQPLTDAQRACLVRLRSGAVSLWDFGSTTISKLRAAGYITTAGGFASITEAGRSAL